jgi:hypothetical protein
MQAGMPAMQEPITQTEGQAESAPVHPEEIRASVDLRIGKNVALKATVRTTPAGLVTAGVMVAAIVLSSRSSCGQYGVATRPEGLSTEAADAPPQNRQTNRAPMSGAAPSAPATGLGTRSSLQESTRLPTCSMKPY